MWVGLNKKHYDCYLGLDWFRGGSMCDCGLCCGVVIDVVGFGSGWSKWWGHQAKILFIGCSVGLV